MSLIKFIKYITLSSLFGLFCIFLFVVYTLSEIPLERLRPYQDPAVLGDKVVLEEGALASKQELLAFQLFSRDRNSSKKWWMEKLEVKDLHEVEKGLVSLDSSLKLEELLENHCERAYCYQHRMEFKNIPALFWKGLIGIEDFRFLSHFGIDIKSILRALITDIMEMRLVQGGSTLTQQLAKNLFFSNEKTIIRKVKEMIVAIYIESKFSKENILEAYFNEFVWGSLQGVRIKGLYAASIFYFSKKPEQLNPYEASILVAILNGPYYFHPIRQLDRLIKKTDTLYNKLVGMKLFAGDHDWDKRTWDSWREELIRKNEERLYFSLWWSKKLKAKNLNSYEKFSFVHKAHQTLKLIQEKAPGRDFSVKAFFGSPGEKFEGFSFYSKFERNHKTAIKNERHQVGSTLKPIIYSLIEKDWDKEKMISTEPLTLSLNSGDWSPKEAHKNLPSQVTIQEALLRSYNRPLIRLANDFGFDRLQGRLLEFIPNLKTPLGEYPAQLLGAVELSVEELFRAYSLFIQSQCFLARQGNENILYLMADPRQTTVSRQLGKHMKNMRFFGKTGTSNKGYDNWYVSYDGKFLGIIWVGLEGPRQGKDTNLYGGSTAFRVYRDFSRDRGKRFHELSCTD